MTKAWMKGLTTVSSVRADVRPDAAFPSPTQPQRKRGVALEDAILAAAYAELSEAGYASFSVEAVAARARTGKASIYRRWPSKVDLVLDALTVGLPTPAECGLTAELPADATTAVALRGVADAIIAVLDSPAGDAMRAVKCEAVVDPELAQAVDERLQGPRRAALLAILERGVARGEVRPEAVTALVADVLPALLSYMILLRRVPVSEDEVHAIIDTVLLPLVEAR